ncbi:hypothetical protein DH2020_039402 [Rehmannia glutinosa]|uniref:Calcium load-activated calcium channel n=1 Tax=Rehmannia glutinosa TaxID=99300 RepID=A0ABR0UX52_REHGL
MATHLSHRLLQIHQIHHRQSLQKARNHENNRRKHRLLKPTQKSSKIKKIDRVETSLKESSRDLSMFKFKSGAVVAVILFMVFGLLNSLFEGKPVAKIPFVPIRLVQKMSHRGLPGDDMTDCSMAFLYLLCSISIRTNLQKFLGFSPPRGAAGAGFFPMPDPKSKKCSVPKSALGGGLGKDWREEHRDAVAIDVAKARLSYLHHDCRSCILQLDVKRKTS